MSIIQRNSESSLQDAAKLVEMAEIHVSTRLTDNLLAFGLGACVAVCIYDSRMRVAGMAHVIAPCKESFHVGNASRIAGASPGMFAESAIPMLIENIVHSGGTRSGLRGVIVGGARVFGSLTNSSGSSSGLDVGERNTFAASKILEASGVRLCAADVGGSFGRSVLIRVCDGSVYVKTIGGEFRNLCVLSRVSEEEAA